jgi:16S rRNA (adenine1518-N6/adenine1519-N6)-dimethyltransferase
MAAFGQRRKTLRNALRNVLPDSAITDLGIDSGDRAETLAVEAYVRLSDRLTELRAHIANDAG